jgi:hypothetical protein
MVLADTTTTITAIFAAVAAFAAWATVAANLRRQRLDRQPNVSAGFLNIRRIGKQKIEFVNAGPGLAIQLGFFLYAGPPEGLWSGGIVGNGHLQAGERDLVDVPLPTLKTAEFVWACRDIDQRLHIWSYSGKHKRLKKGSYPSQDEAFRLMYPETTLPPRNVGATEDPTALGV